MLNSALLPTLDTSPADALPPIPVLDLGADFALGSLIREEARAHTMLDAATQGTPPSLLRQLDRVSRAWLVRHSNSHLAEIDAIAARLNRPGTYFFSVNYEWGCTCRVAPSPTGTSARLIRVLDWRTKGLGRHIMAVRVKAPAGDFVTMTWPGYTGVMQALAPGRFAVAVNQAPMRKLGGGLLALDWAANRARVWRQPHATAAHVVRGVVETAATYAEARQRLIETPITAPAIFTLAGLRPHETCVIERQETSANVLDGAGVAANNWQSPGWHGRPRGNDSHGRAAQMTDIAPVMDGRFPWLKAPTRIGLAHPSISPYGVFRTRDDKDILISIQNDREWLSFCQVVLADASLAGNPKFATNVVRVANRPDTDGLVAAVFRRTHEAELRALLTRADIAFASVNDMAALAAHPHLRRITVATAAGPVTYPAPAPIFMGEARTYGPVPTIGDHRPLGPRAKN